ncbi:MAG: DUF6134 family protein [Sneathiella sp.]|uniref:DUF6134 family protein n=1 Tax=Sneathiella sp. TaxID=1964365 RepID=UPI003002D954
MLNILRLTPVLLLTIIGGLNSEEARGDIVSKDDPTILYGDKLEFAVLRNGESVGSHLVTFRKISADLEVTSKFNLELSLLGISIYRYQYSSVGNWSGGMLISLKVDVNDDGSKTQNFAAREDKNFWLNGAKLAGAENDTLFPTNHWNVDVLQQDKVLNTITGEVNRTKIRNEGQEVIAVKGGEVKANRYLYTGDLNATVWYDREGRWVKLKFKGQDNSDIEYYCLTCSRVSDQMDDQ